MYTCICTHVYICTRTHTNSSIYKYSRTCVYVHTNVYISDIDNDWYLDFSLWMHICICIHTFACNTCIQKYKHAYIHTFITRNLNIHHCQYLNTFTHTFTQTSTHTSEHTQTHIPTCIHVYIYPYRKYQVTTIINIRIIFTGPYTPSSTLCHRIYTCRYASIHTCIPRNPGYHHRQYLKQQTKLAIAPQIATIPAYLTCWLYMRTYAFQNMSRNTHAYEYICIDTPSLSKKRLQSLLRSRGHLHGRRCTCSLYIYIHRYSHVYV